MFSVGAGRLCDDLDGVVFAFVLIANLGKRERVKRLGEIG